MVLRFSFYLEKGMVKKHHKDLKRKASLLNKPNRISGGNLIDLEELSDKAVFKEQVIKHLNS